MVLYLLFYIVALYAYLTTVKSKQKNVKFLFYYFVCSTIFVGISDMLGGYDRYIYAELLDLERHHLWQTICLEDGMNITPWSI